jgi:arylsulfatase A-like enzyme
MGCYGDALARTPNVDRLAAKGMRFDVAWSTAPVCAPARTAILTGLYPSSSGGLHMRSMVSLPPQFQTYPEFLRSAGYYCTNNLKEDYNVLTPADLWHESSRTAHWRNRRAGQPFFAVFNSTKSHESQIRTRPHQAITDPARVRVPAYHPDTPEVRQDWAQYYDKVSEADADAGVVLREIAQAGLADDTIVFYYGDHGNGMPRGKRWPSNSGLRVPLVVYFPPKWQHLAPAEYAPGGLSERRVSFVDLAPTLLSLVGIQPPEWMQGHAFAGPHQVPGPQYLYGERGRMDERLDLVRSVTDGRYVYLRNYYPHVSQGQRVAYQFQTPTTRIWRETFDRGDATPAQSIFWQIPKAPEELYDLQNDPDEVHNLAGSTEHRAVLERLRQAQREHLRAIRDVMFLPEGEMFARGAGEAPYTLARDPQRYPLERVVATAELASSLRAEDTLKLVGLADDKDSAVRYWAVMGLLMRGRMACGVRRISCARGCRTRHRSFASAQRKRSCGMGQRRRGGRRSRRCARCSNRRSKTSLWRWRRCRRSRRRDRRRPHCIPSSSRSQRLRSHPTSASRSMCRDSGRTSKKSAWQRQSAGKSIVGGTLAGSRTRGLPGACERWRIRNRWKAAVF